mmetsp:Transcript_131953/g.282207  ORF Transcript_131953/g.282207 Transcript_131953/m.282207 type:complete len:257 (-) Transcript_131953:158-928(-)
MEGHFEIAHHRAAPDAVDRQARLLVYDEYCASATAGGSVCLECEWCELAGRAAPLDQGQATLHLVVVRRETVSIVLVIDNLARDGFATPLGVPQGPLCVHRHGLTASVDPDGLQVFQFRLLGLFDLVVPHPVQALLVKLYHGDVRLCAIDHSLHIPRGARRDVDRCHKEELLPLVGGEATCVRNLDTSLDRAHMRPINPIGDHCEDKDTKAAIEPSQGDVQKEQHIPERHGGHDVQHAVGEPLCNSGAGLGVGGGC